MTIYLFASIQQLMNVLMLQSTLLLSPIFCQKSVGKLSNQIIYFIFSYMFTLDSKMRNEIIRRDGSCYDCLVLRWLVTKVQLHVHHIKTRGSWWDHSYNNLITLCHVHHTIHAHGMDQAAHQQRYEIYTSQFTEPSWWQDAIIEHMQKEKQRKAIEKHYRQVAQKRQKEQFIKKHGMSPSKFAYQKKKEYLKKRIEIIKWV